MITYWHVLVKRHETLISNFDLYHYIGLGSRRFQMLKVVDAGIFSHFGDT